MTALERKRQVARECSVRWRARHPEQAARIQRSAKLRRTYGITLDDFERMLEAQGGVCAICGKPETHAWRGVVRALNVDHCHTTGAIRGLLCNACNHSLGALADDPALFRAAADYLERTVSA